MSLNGPVPAVLAQGDAAEIAAMLKARLPARSRGLPFDVWQAQAASLGTALAPALVWLRDRQSVSLDWQTLHRIFAFDAIETLVRQRRLRLDDDAVVCAPGDDGSRNLPDDLVQPLRRYLEELPGYGLSRTQAERRGDTPRLQHGYVSHCLMVATSDEGDEGPADPMAVAA